MGPLQMLLIVCGLLNLAFAGFLYVHSDKKQAIAFYVLISVFASLWSLCTLATGFTLSARDLYLALSGHYIFGFLAYVSFFWFTLYFKSKPGWLTLACASICSVLSVAFVLTISLGNYLFSVRSSGFGLYERIVFNPSAYPAFIIVLSSVFGIGLFILLWRLHQMSKTMGRQSAEVQQVYFALLTNLVAGVLGIILNLILPLYGNWSLFYINPILVTLALICIGFYNLLKYHLFNVRIVLTEFFVSGIWILSLARMILSTTRTDLIINAIVFIGSLFFGILLIQSVIREMRTREQVEKLVAQLEKANDQQQALIHFIAHQIKGFITKSRNVFSLLLEGDYGQLPETMKPLVEEGFRSDTQGANTIQTILSAANIKSGAVSYGSELVDFGGIVKDVANALRPVAETKQLKLTLDMGIDPYFVTGDRFYLEQAVKNIIDNAIKYTPEGSIKISVKQTDGTIRFTEQDTGVGISADDMSHLFTEGGHGKDSIKVNIESTGFGLYIVKNIIESHHGKVWAESAGEGKGSTFIIEIPVAGTAPAA